MTIVADQSAETLVAASVKRTPPSAPPRIEPAATSHEKDKSVCVDTPEGDADDRPELIDGLYERHDTGPGDDLRVIGGVWLAVILVALGVQLIQALASRLF